MSWSQRHWAKNSEAQSGSCQAWKKSLPGFICRSLDTVKTVKGTSYPAGVIWFGVNKVSPSHCGCPPGQAQDVSNGWLQKQNSKRWKQMLNCPILKNVQVVPYHKDASWCCTRVAAADRFTYRLVVKRLTPGENWVVVECMHQVRVHIAKEKTDLWKERRLHQGNSKKRWF